MLTTLINMNNMYNDAPHPWGIYFQDSASTSFEGITELHDQIMFYLIIILFGVGYIIWSIMRSFNEKQIIHKYLNHGTFIELIWTISPALILIAIAFPSFKLLYLMDDVFDPALTIKVVGHQWYWSYEYTDFTTKEGESWEFDSYMIPEDDLEIGQLRMLEVDQRVVLPIDTHVRFVITGADVIHDFAVPSLGLKVDANPGRLNQASVVIKREGVFYGQCSELCGVNHSAMPIAIQAVSLEKFLFWLDSSLSD
jgi:cytochrome c oxidase subunit 2